MFESKRNRLARRCIFNAFKILTILACLTFAAFAQRSGGWTATRRGLPGKDLNAVFFVDSKRGWVAGDGGQVLRTEDAGKTWIRQTVPSADQISDIYFRNRDDGYLLAGSRIFTTEDGGDTWREARRFTAADLGDGASGDAPELYSVRFTSKKKGWIVGAVTRRDTIVDSLVIYTSDAGQTWTRQRVPSRTELIHLCFAGDKRGWIVGANGFMLHTSDGGQTWSPQRTGTTATLYHVDFRGDQTGWAVGAAATILRTTDGGATWVLVSPPSALARRATLLSVQFANEDEGWIVGRGGVILRSADGGVTWLEQASATTQNLFALCVEKKNNWAVGGDGMVLQYVR